MYLSTFEPISSLSQDNRRCIKGIHKMQTSSLLCEFIMLHAPESRVNGTVPSVNKSLWDIKSLASQILPPPGVKSMSRESVHFVFVPHQLRESKGLPVSTLHFQSFHRSDRSIDSLWESAVTLVLVLVWYFRSGTSLLTTHYEISFPILPVIRSLRAFALVEGVHHGTKFVRKKGV